MTFNYESSLRTVGPGAIKAWSSWESFLLREASPAPPMVQVFSMELPYQLKY